MSEPVRLSDIVGTERTLVNPRDYPDETFANYSLPAYDEAGEPEIVKGREIESAKFLARDGTILVSKLNPRIRRVWNVEAPLGLRALTSTEFVNVVPKRPEHARFILQLLGSDLVYSVLERVAEGTTNSHVRFRPAVIEGIRFRQIAAEKFWLRIGEILREVDNAIHQTQALIAKMQQVKAGMMHDLFTRGVTPDGKVRPTPAAAPNLYKESEAGLVPHDWRPMTVGELAEFFNGNSFVANEWSVNGLPIIRIQNLNGEQDFNYYAGAPQESWTIRSGDLLFAWAGTRETSFGPRIWDGPTAVLNQHIFKVVPRTDVISSTLFLNDLLSFHLSRIIMAAHGFKQSFVHVTRSELTEVVVGVPSSHEQENVTARTTSVRSLIREYESELSKLRMLKRGLMHDLLTGSVPVSLAAG